MTASTRTVLELAARIVDYEPAPTAVGSAAPSLPTGRLRVVPEPGPTPSTEPVARPRPPDALPPAAALTFADAALRRALEVSDRRRPLAQLRPLVAPALFDAMAAWPRRPGTDGAAVLRRVRLRTARQHDGMATALEVFASFSRGPRLHAAAGRIEMISDRWQFIALQLG